jgi:Domain of unknown function (DUF4410)
MPLPTARKVTPSAPETQFEWPTGEKEMFNAAKERAKKVAVLALVMWGFWTPLLQAQEKSIIVVHPFTMANGVSWPYDMHQMTVQTIAELQHKDGKKFEISAEPPAGQSHVYTLEGEVLDWQPGNRAKRMLVGVGTGRETAKIRYWLSDANGKKVFEHEDTIRAEYWGNAYADSVGQLAHPFADKIADRLSEAKIN